MMAIATKVTTKTKLQLTLLFAFNMLFINCFPIEIIIVEVVVNPMPKEDVYP